MSNLLFERVRGGARRKHFRRIAFRLSKPTAPTKPRAVSTASIMPSSGGIVLKATKFGVVRQSELVAMQKIVRRKLDRKGSLLIYTFPFVSLTAKPLAVRMGKGKGAVVTWTIPCAPGKLILRVYGVTETQGRRALAAAARKLNFETVVTNFVMKGKKPKTELQFIYQMYKKITIRDLRPPSRRVSLRRYIFSRFTWFKRSKGSKHRTLGNSWFPKIF